MNNETWIKLYRKTNYNGIMRDLSAWAVFSWLLINVDYETGKRTMGRFQISDELGIKPNTLYKVLHRLEKKWGVIQLTSQKTYTEVLVVNWAKYQHNKSDESNASQTPVKQSSTTSNTKQERRIKNNTIAGVSNPFGSTTYLKELPLEDLTNFNLTYNATKAQIQDEAQQIILYCESKGKKYSNYRSTLQSWLLRKYGKRSSDGYIRRYEN